VKICRFFGVLFFAALLLMTEASVQAQSAGSEYFSETGHYVKGEFWDYYRANKNAQSLFGYPITEAFTKDGVTIQYFQRARFELRPDLPVSQRVQLSPLGTLTYTPGGQLSIVNPFACRYFIKTGFSVCYAFLDYFNNYGGLEQFGYPISPFEYHDDLIVQYFEKGRFEWKPWMPEGQRVGLADLGKIYFDQIKEDPNLLKPLPDNEIGRLISLQVRAFVWKAVTLATDQQLVYVIVQDQTLQPVTAAQGTATVRWPVGNPETISFSTNSSGVGIVPLTFSGQTYGQLVYIDILVTKDGLTATTTTSFRIWY
jgi:hypothetical protein